MAGVSPQLQLLLVQAQTSGEDVGTTLDSAIDAWMQVVAGGGDRGAASALAALRHLLRTSCAPAAAVAAITGTSGHPAALGMLLAELLARGVVPARELLAAASPVAGEANLLAAAVAQLHAAATADTLSAATAMAAASAFDSLVKLLVTASHSTGGYSASADELGNQRAAKRALAQLRCAWLGGMPAAQEQLLQVAGAHGGGVGLLAAMVDAADRQAFPRASATSWIAAELRHILQTAPDGVSGPAIVQEHREQGTWAAAAGIEGTAWPGAMAAFATALPSDTLMQRVQTVARDGSLAVPRAAALLAAAAVLRPHDWPVIASWLRREASAALAGREAGLLRSLLLLQRDLLVTTPPEAGSGGSSGSCGSGSGSRRQGQQAHHERRMLAQGPVAGCPSQQLERGQGQLASPEQRYCVWLVDVLLGGPAGSVDWAGGAAGAAEAAAYDAGGGAQQHLQFLVQQVLVPLCPEDSPRWLTAQRDALGLLLGKQGEAARRGLPSLPAGGRQAAEEYLGLAEQRLRALQATQGDQAQQQGLGPAAPPTSLQKGRAIARMLIQEWVDGRGQLLEKTIQTMMAKAANVFTRGELHSMLAPALLEPIADAEASQQRAAFMEYLHDELQSRKDTHIKQHFKPEAVRLYRRRCLQAQLEGASLEELARRAPTLLLAGSAGAGCSGTLGGISGHQLLDRVARLVGEQLAGWTQEQQEPRQAAQRPGSARHVPAVPQRLAEVLLGMWMAAYTAAMGGTDTPAGAHPQAGHPSAAAVAAHLLSIVHSHPPLHGPFLRRVAAVLRGEDSCSAAAGTPAQQRGELTASQQLAAAAMLASTAGALLLPAAQQQSLPGASCRGVQAAGSSLAALRPLFVWQTESGSACSASASSASERPCQLPGPLWLQRLLARMPLGSAAAMQRASAVASAHLSCLRHFRSYALLPCGSEGVDAGITSNSPTELLLLWWRRPALAPAGPAAFSDEFAGSLVFPACASALQLQQWLLLRLTVAHPLMGHAASAHGGASGVGSSSAKRQRLDGWPGQHGGAAGVAGEAGSPAEAVLQECAGSLQSALGAPLAAAAGKLPLQGFLRLEAAAAAASSSGDDLLLPGTADPVFRLCCSLYMDLPAAPAAAAPGCDAAASSRRGRPGCASLAGLFEPLIAGRYRGGGLPAGWSQPGLASGCEGAEALEVIPDSEDQDAPLAAAAAASAQAAQGQPALAAALGAALGELLVEAGILLAAHVQSRRPPAVAVAAVPACQRAAAHMLRVLANGQGGATPERLLTTLLAALVRQCRQQLSSQAVLPSQPSQRPPLQGGQQPAVPPSYADGPAAVAVAQQAAAFASALLLELLPLPASSAGGFLAFERQQARLAAAAAAVQQALADGEADGQSPTVSLQQQLEAALGAAQHV